MNALSFASTMLTTIAGLPLPAAKSSSAAVRLGALTPVSDINALEMGRMNCMNALDTLLFFVRWRDADGLHEVRTDEPATLVAGLVAATGGEPRDVEIRRPSLEEVYLRLIGDDGDAS